MDKLLLLSCCPEDKASLNLNHLAEKYFGSSDLLGLWMDPYKEPRAVLMFQNAKDLNSIIKFYHEELRRDRIVLSTEKPAQSIFIRTYNAEYYGLIDKLDLLLTKKLHYTFSSKFKQEDGCFEFTLKDGWDAVLAVCEAEWKLGDIKLTVCPYFDAFKKPYEEQFKNGMSLNDKVALACAENSDVNQLTSLKDIKKAEKKSTPVYFKHQLMSNILSNLNIVEAFKHLGFEFILKATQIEIIGSGIMLRKIQEVITDADRMVSGFIASLGDMISLEVDTELTKYSLIISQDGEKLTLNVADKNGFKVLFQEFVCSMQTFIATYKFQHHFFLGILEVLDLKAAVKKEKSQLILDYDLSNKKVNISGSFSEIHSFTTILQKEEKKISIAEMEKSFLENKNVLHKIKKENHLLDFCGFTGLFVNVDSKVMNFSDYINDLIITDKIITDNIETQNWKSYIDSFNKINKLSHLSILENDVFLMSLKYEGSVHYIFLQIIKDNLQSTDKYSTDLNNCLATHPETNLTKPDSCHLSIIKTKEKNDEKVKIEPFSLWIFNQLKMIQALEDSFDGICINFIPNSYGLLIEPFSHSSHIDKEIQKICAQFSFSNEEYTFLNKEEVRSHLKKRIQANGLHFTINKDSDIFFEVLNSQKEKMNFNSFLDKLLYREQVLTAKESIIISNSKFWHFVESFNQRNPVRYLTLQDRKIVLLTVSDDDFANEIKEINDFFYFSNLKLLDSNYKIFSLSDIDVCFQKKYQYEYFQLIFDDLKTAKGVFDIRLNQSNITVICHPQHKNFLMNRISSICENIQPLEKKIEICGLEEFTETDEGQKLISKISLTTKCYIQVAGKKAKHSRELEKITVENIDYKAILLYTAKCKGFNIHLVQGKIDDLVIEMSVQLTPFDEDDVYLRRIRSQHLRLSLPPWFADGKDFHHLNMLKEDLQKKICIIFKQAEEFNCFEIAFYMEKIHDAKYPVPLDFLTQTILQNLFHTTSTNGASMVPAFNIYICEPKHSSVFKAFQYYLKKYENYFGSPDLEKWEEISPPSTYKYSSYLENAVEVKTHNPSKVNGNILFCYPISPCLNASTCPVVNEKDVSRPMLEASLKSIEDLNPDGISLNEHFEVQCFPNIIKDVIIYCSPPWGIDSAEAIYESLKTCLTISISIPKSAVHIVPPGICPDSKYPSKYLAQAVFKALDKLCIEGLCPKNLKIVFIVTDLEYKEEFDKELSKRSQLNKNKNSLISSFFSFLSSLGSNYKTVPPESQFVKTTVVEKTTVIFVSPSAEDRLKAASKLQTDLNDLISENTKELSLSKEEISVFKSIVEEKQYFPVFLEYTKRKDKNNFSKTCLESKLTIKGLKKQWVIDFINIISPPDRNFKQHVKSQEQSSVDPRNLTKSNQTQSKAKKSENFSAMCGKQKAQRSKNNNSQKNNIDLMKFTWKYEKNFNDFQELESEIIQHLEKFYTVDAAPQKRLSNMFQTFDFIDFDNMTIKKKEIEFPIIRAEKIEEDVQITLPKHWTKYDDDSVTFQLVQIDYQSLNQENFMKDLTEILKSFNSFEIEKIDEVQNKNLFRRFQTKKILLKQPNQQKLWHRVSEGSALKVCHYGFHKRFSAFPADLSYVGDGVAFSTRLENCLSISEKKNELDICLIYADVLTGKTVKGRQHLRSPRKKKPTEEEFHSAQLNDVFMIFSDTQAYPLYVIKLKKKKTKTEKNN